MKVFLIILFTVSGHNGQEFTRSAPMDDLPACWAKAAQEADNMVKEHDKVGMTILRIGCEIQFGDPV